MVFVAGFLRNLQIIIYRGRNIRSFGGKVVPVGISILSSVFAAVNLVGFMTQTARRSEISTGALGLPASLSAATWLERYAIP